MRAGAVIGCLLLCGDDGLFWFGQYDLSTLQKRLDKSFINANTRQRVTTTIYEICQALNYQDVSNREINLTNEEFM